MKLSGFFLSACLFFVVVILLTGGIFFTALGLFPSLEWRLLSVFADRSQLFFVFGMIFLGLATSLLIPFYYLNRGQYYQLEMHAHKLTVDRALLRQLVERYFRESLSDPSFEADIVIHSGQKIEVVAEMLLKPLEEQELFLKKVEVELGTLLEKHLGYSQSFLLTVLFKG